MRRLVISDDPCNVVGDFLSLRLRADSWQLAGERVEHMGRYMSHICASVQHGERILGDVHVLQSAQGGGGSVSKRCYYIYTFGWDEDIGWAPSREVAAATNA